MARKKPTRKSSSRPASRTTSQKKTPARKAAKAKAAKAKAAKTKAAKAAVKSSARKKLARKGRAPTPAKRARPKQRIAISHYRNEDFKADGLRAYAHYRDLGFADATSGLAQAHVIRLIEPCDPDEVSKLHYHDVEFQMIYVLKGWVKTYMEGQGETLMQQGSAWTQPPKIKHLIMDYSDEVELLEVILPAKFRTVELTA
jgi:mannose-6-phosphate isomerase-like protein (cupin superfamily)